MDAHPDDLTATDDLTLVGAARAGDRLAFGVLYLRHHAAAWRMACVASRFSPDAELAVIEGFTRVFSALPEESEEFKRDGVNFRPYLLACVRQAALDRARAAGRAEPDSRRHPSRPGRSPASPPPPAPLAGLAPDGEVVLSSLEHHVARGALAALPERSRTALWLSEVEAMTPGEVAGILGSLPEMVVALTGGARAEVQAAQEAARGRHEVRADCRFTVDHLDAYRAGTLDPKKGVLVRSHLDICPPCRMRLGELINTRDTLAAAVPAAPLLGGEAQQHWLAAVTEVRPAERLLPPGLAAAAPGRRLPDVLRRRGHGAAGRRAEPHPADSLTSSGWTGAPGASGSPVPSLPPTWTIPPGRAVGTRPPGRDLRTRRRAAVAGLPVVARRAGRAIRPSVPAVALIVAWLGVMLSVPRLMQPETVPGPEGLALPAVQAYVPDFLPGAAKPRSAPVSRSAPATRSASPPPGPEAGALGAGAGGDGEAAVALISTAGSPRSRAGAPAQAKAGAPEPSPFAAATEVVPVVPGVPGVPAVVTASAPTVVPLLVASTVPPAPAPALSPDAKAAKDAKPKKDSTSVMEGKPRQEAKAERKSETDQESKRSKGSERRKQPATRARIVTA